MKVAVFIALVVWFGLCAFVMAHLVAWIWNMALPMHIRPVQAYALSLIAAALTHQRSHNNEDLVEFAANVVTYSIAELLMLFAGGLVVRALI